MKLPIIFLIPLLLVLSTFISSLLVYQEAKRTATDSIRKDTIEHLTLDITRLQNVLYNLLTESANNLQSARLNLSVTAMDPSIRILLLADQNDKTIMANHYLWENQAASEVAEYNPNIASKVRQTNIPSVFYSEYDQTLLTGYHPVVLKLESERGLPIKRLGILFSKVSIDSKLNNAWRNAFNESLSFGILMLSASAIVAFLLHFLVSARLKRLANTADQFSTGNLDARVELSGNDELSQLGASFDQMALRIKSEFDRREKAENELRNLNEDLEQHITERTSELEKKKQELIDSQTVAHLANKMAALGEMASGIEHEINSPLQAINLLTFKLKRDITKHENELNIVTIDKIEDAVKKVSSIVDSLGKVSRDSSADPFVEAKISDIINDVLGITSERYKLKGIHIQCEYSDGLNHYMLYCQRLQIGQIIINLLNNAYDAVIDSDNKWIKIIISDTPDNIIISVCDSGEGIPIENQTRIFEPMFTSKGIGKGTGLGLSISSEIAKCHKGSLKIDNESDNTCFVLTLPKQNIQD